MRPRDLMLHRLADLVLTVRRPHPVRVGIDGCSAAGKTTLADELATVLRGRTQRPVIRAQIDHFKRRVDQRIAYPPDSPESYYFDSWDYPAVREHLLEPLGPHGDRRYRDAVMDLRGRHPVDRPVLVAADDAILVADGAFLQRPELESGWDLVVYVDVDFDVVLRRGIERDQAWMGSAAQTEARYRSKYIPGERIYLEQVRPAQRADVVVDNVDPLAPVLSTRVRQ